MSISNKLIVLNTAKQDIRQAISNKGVDMTAVPFTDYAEKIDEIQTGGGSGEWEPSPIWNWWDIEQIIKDDVQGSYQYKVIELISDSFPTTSLSGAQAYKTSDGAYYTSNANHTWDIAQDRQAYDDYGEPTYKTRYIIRYYTNENISLTLESECLYFVIDKAKFDASGIGNTTASNAKRTLISFKLINGADLQTSISSMNNMFRNCHSLVSVPSFNTSNVTDMSYMFYICHSLVSVPSFNTSNVTDMSYMFSICYSLVSVPSFNTSNVTDMNNMFRNCYSLVSVPSFDTSNVTDMSYMFYYCYSLVSVPSFNASNVTTVVNMFRNCSSLVFIKLKNLKIALTLASTSYGTNINRDSLLYIIRNRAGTNAITLTIDATNLAKLTTEEIAEATDVYNITLA